MAILWEYAGGGYNCGKYSGVLWSWDNTDNGFIGGILVALKPLRMMGRGEPVINQQESIARNTK